MITTSFRVCDGVVSDGWGIRKTLIFFLWAKESENKETIWETIILRNTLFIKFQETRNPPFE